MLIRAMLLATGLLGPVAGAADAGPDAILHTPTVCVSCADYADHLRQQGFRVTLKPTADMAAIKRRLKVPADLESVPTLEVGGYVVEGHVPASDIHTLLQERPRARGLAVPGLPMGAPGREPAPPSCETGCTMLDVESSVRPERREAFNTYLIAPNGTTRVWARH